MRHCDGNSDFVGMIRIVGSNVSQLGVEWFSSNLVGIPWHTHTFFSTDGHNVTASLTAWNTIRTNRTGDALNSRASSEVDTVKGDL